jgi:hypothetical protein
VLSSSRVLGALVLVKAADVALRDGALLPLLVWSTAGVALLTGRNGRAWWAALLVAGAGLAADLPLDLRRQHLVLLMGVALVGAVTADDAERLRLWRLQLTALYAFAALAKLNETFLSGSVLAAALDGGPVPLPRLPVLVLVALGVALVAVEALLAVTPWVLQRLGLLLAVGLHGTALLVVGGGSLVTLRLVVFGGTAVLLHAVSAGVVPVRRSASARP